MLNREIQFVVISADINRKKIMQKQFADLQLDSAFDIHYDEGITVNNTPYNLVPKYLPFLETKEILCCFLSHVKAMKWYIENSSSPFLLLLEDDAALEKLNFKNNLLKLIPKFKNKKFDYISLGYLPDTISNNLLQHPLIEKDENIYWNLYKIYLHSTWGTQAQLFPKKTVESLLNIYDKSSTEEIFKSICEYLSQNIFYYINTPRLQIDNLNGLLKHQSIVFPPMVIELNNFNSLISMEKSYERWVFGEKKNFYKLSNYYSYSENNKYVLNKNFQHPIFRNSIIKSVIELVCRFGSNSCDKYKYNININITIDKPIK